LAALILVSQQTHKASLKLIVDRLIEDLKEGKAFSAALSQHANIFSRLYVALIRSSEAGGFLEEAMRRLADFLENEEELKVKVRSAMVYPALIAAVGLITIFLLLSFVIPKLVLVFRDFGQVLPLPTQILIGISYLVSHYWWIIALAVVIVLFLTNRSARSSEGKLFFDSLKLNTPLVGGHIKGDGKIFQILTTL
jgi:general secretion pathway protein F